MAEQPAAKESAKTAPQSGTARESDAVSPEYFSSFLREYRPPAQNLTYDLLDGRFQIDFSKPLAHLNSKTAIACEATDNTDPQKKLYALVCQSDTIPRLGTINALQKAEVHPYLVAPIASGVVNVSQNNESRFVVILPQPLGQPLSKLFENKRNLDEYFIINNIITPLAETINYMQELGLTHGRINPDNIYFQEKAMLGECVSEPCGFSQPFYYEPLERMQAQAAAKGSSTNPDFHALGVLVIYTLFGAKHFANITRDSLMHVAFREGIYQAITQGRQHPEAFDDFLRGILHDNPSDRWNWRQIKPWIGGRHFNVLTPPSPTANVRPYEFQGRQIYTRREIAEYFFRDWVNIPAALKDKQFLHWLGVSLKNKLLAEQVERIISLMDQLTAKQELQFNEQLMRILVLLDPKGPVRMYPMSFYPDGLGWLYLDYFKHQKEKELNLLLHFLEQNMLLFWLHLQNEEKQDNPDQEVSRYDPLNNIVTRLDKMRVCLRSKGPGFGLERILYELNPALSCQSPLLRDKYITDVKSLMIALDALAPSLINNKNAIDAHITSFLTSKLSIQHTIRLRELENIPELANNRECFALHILSMAQYRCGNIRLPGLSHWMALQLLPLFEKIKSRSIRQEIRKKLKEAAASGYIQLMAKEIIDSSLVANDARNYHFAMLRYQSNMAQINSMKKGERLISRSEEMGLSIAKYLAYALFALTFYTVVLKESL